MSSSGSRTHWDGHSGGFGEIVSRSFSPINVRARCINSSRYYSVRYTPNIFSSCWAYTWTLELGPALDLGYRGLASNCLPLAYIKAGFAVTVKRVTRQVGCMNRSMNRYLSVSDNTMYLVLYWTRGRECDSTPEKHGVPTRLANPASANTIALNGCIKDSIDSQPGLVGSLHNPVLPGV